MVAALASSGERDLRPLDFSNATEVGDSGTRIVLPGDCLDVGEDFLLGHGVYAQDGVVRASVCGVVQTVNRLLYVKPLQSRYEGSVGDVVVGRVAEIANGKWLVDLNAARLAVLSLGAISLEEQRRRLESDALEMAKYFRVNDVICCEVQKVQTDGTILLHTRSGRYGRLFNGLSLRVKPQLVKRHARHIATLECGLQLILGVNGQLWMGLPNQVSAADSLNFCNFQQTQRRVPAAARMQLALVRNVIKCLAAVGLSISKETIDACMRIAAAEKLRPHMLLFPEHANGLIRKLAAEQLEQL